MPAVRVARVECGSIAAALGIAPGTELLSVNGRRVTDFLDWEFLTADDDLVVEARDPGGDAVTYEIERGEGESWASSSSRQPSGGARTGASSASSRDCLPGSGAHSISAMTTTDCRSRTATSRRCRIRERDTSASSSTGSRRSTSRVHATPPEARAVLLNNPKVPDIVEQLRHSPLAESSSTRRWSSSRGSTTAPRSSDRSTDLWDLGDAVLTVAIVPVGLTQFSHLYTGRVDGSRRCAEHPRRRARWAARAAVERGARGCSARTSCTCGPGAAPATPPTTASSRRSRTE